ncbi:MAG: AAA family ATPase [FCB group bacterium]|nr:AAA family ATPase [FCB group bacterium]
MTDEKVILHSLRMENFGCFDDHRINFEPGLNQLVGPNESGKSTIIKALFTAIFEDGGTRKRTVSSLTSWSQKSPIRLTLVFAIGEKEFTLARSYGDGRDLMTDSDGIKYEGKAIGEKLAVYFGTSDRNLFESVFCFDADSPKSLERHRDKLKSALEKPVFSGFDRIRADNYLEEEIKKIDNPRAHGPRRLDIIDEQMRHYIQEKNRLEEQLANLRKSENELEKAREAGKQFEVDITLLEKTTAGADAYQKLDTRMAGLEERLQSHLSSFSRAEQVSEDLEKLEREIENILVPETEEFDKIVATRETLEKAVEVSKRTMDDLLGERRRANHSFLSVTLVLALACFVYILQINGYFQSEAVSGFIPYTVPVMAFIWMVRIWFYLAQGRKKKKSTIIFRERVNSLDAFYAGLNETFQIQAADPIRALGEAINRREALGISIQNLTDTMRMLSDGKGKEHLEENKINLEEEVSQINRELSPLVEFAAASNSLPDLKEQLTSKRVRYNALREQLALLDERCKAIEPLEQNIVIINDELETLKRLHRDISDHLEALKIARAALNRAADGMITRTFTLYGEDASLHLSELTDGRYSRLRFGEDTHVFEIRIDENKDWRQLGDYLSSSTRDTVYLALRLAAMDRLSQGFSAPAIFDQADSRLDGDRRKNYLTILSRLARNRQVLHVAVRRSDSIKEAHVIDLGGMVRESAGEASSH